MLEYQIGQLVGNCHVGDSHKEIFDYVVSKIRGGRDAYDKLPSRDKTFLMNECRKAHNANRKTYSAVMQTRTF